MLRSTRVESIAEREEEEEEEADEDEAIGCCCSVPVRAGMNGS